jgi:hypothetical protein
VSYWNGTTAANFGMPVASSGACEYECDAIKVQTTHWNDNTCPV